MEKKFPFEVIVAGGVRQFYRLRKRLLRGGSTRAEGIRALAGRYDRLECNWYGWLSPADAAVVRGALGLTEEEAEVEVRALRNHDKRRAYLRWRRATGSRRYLDSEK